MVSFWCTPPLVCDMPTFRYSASLGEVLHENQSDFHFVPQVLDFWVVVNTLAVLPERDLHVCLPH